MALITDGFLAGPITAQPLTRNGAKHTGKISDSMALAGYVNHKPQCFHILKFFPSHSTI